MLAGLRSGLSFPLDSATPRFSREQLDAGEYLVEVRLETWPRLGRRAALDDIQRVYSGLSITDEAIAELEAA